MKIGDTFWEVNNSHDIAYYYPREVLSEIYIDYYNTRYGVLTFPNEQQAKKKVEELNKSQENKNE